MVALYGVADSGTDSAALVTTVPDGQYVWDLKRTTEQIVEVMRWKQREGVALRAFVKAQHSLHT
jgi:lipocalin